MIMNDRIMEHEERVEILRIYLEDVIDYPGGLVASGGTLSYAQWNFGVAVDKYIQFEDEKRNVWREFRENLDGKQEVEIESPMVEMKLTSIEKIVRQTQNFHQWFFKNLISPILNEEARILKKSEKNIIHSVSPARAHLDRYSNMFRFKVWERVYFPFVKAIPPRAEPLPAENG